MYQRGMKWETYLEFEGFKDDFIDGLERQTSKTTIAQAETTDILSGGLGEMIVDQRKMNAFLQGGFGEIIAGQQEMNAVMQSGFAAVSYGLESVSNGIESLRADFDWAMGAVLWKMELQHATLRNILTTLQAPLDTQAKELRRRAEDAYVQGWYDEALTDLLESEQKNYQDFAVHQTIGNIYLYHRQPADLDKARAYYLKAGKYATPRSASHAAQSFMHAAFVCYLQRDDKAAIEHARRAMELAPQLLEAFYNHAKFAAAAGQAAVAIPSLERTIRTDRNYAVKARADADFGNIEAAVTDLMERLRSEARQQAQTQWQALQTEINRCVIAPEERAQIEHAQAGVVALMKQDTYFGYLDAPTKIPACRKVFESLRLPERDRLRDQVTGALARLRAALAEYVVPDLVQTRLNSELAEVERLLTQLTFASASAARDKMDACIKQGKAMMAGGVERTVLKGHTGVVYAIAFSPDGATLASGSDDHTVRLWDVAAGRERAVLTGHTHPIQAVAFSPDGTTLASGSADHTVRLWDVARGRELAMLTGHTSSVTAVAFSPDGVTLASGSYDNTVRLWNVATGREQGVLTGHTDTVHAIAFSPDGAMLASGSDDYTVRLWDVATGRERTVLTGRIERVNAVAFSPDGARLASGSWKTVRLWDVATGGEWAMLKHTHAVQAVAFSPDGAMLASGSDDHTVRLWGLAIHKVEWERMERKRQEQAEERKREQEEKRKQAEERKREQEEKRKREEEDLRKQQQAWRAAGCCETCGEKLGFLDKAKGNARCKQHR